MHGPGAGPGRPSAVARVGWRRAAPASLDLTNGTYGTATWLVSGEEIEPLIQRNASDEQRHLQWLLDYQEKQEES